MQKEHLTYEELERYLGDENLSEEYVCFCEPVTAHLDQCALCRDRLDKMLCITTWMEEDVLPKAMYMVQREEQLRRSILSLRLEMMARENRMKDVARRMRLGLLVHTSVSKGDFINDNPTQYTKEGSKQSFVSQSCMPQHTMPQQSVSQPCMPYPAMHQPSAPRSTVSLRYENGKAKVVFNDGKQRNALYSMANMSGGNQRSPFDNDSVTRRGIVKVRFEEGRAQIIVECQKKADVTVIIVKNRDFKSEPLVTKAKWHSERMAAIAEFETEQPEEHYEIYVDIAQE